VRDLGVGIGIGNGGLRGGVRVIFERWWVDGKFCGRGEKRAGSWRRVEGGL
jgi:hypothetical protein